MKDADAAEMLGYKNAKSFLACLTQNRKLRTALMTKQVKSRAGRPSYLFSKAACLQHKAICARTKKRTGHAARGESITEFTLKKFHATMADTRYKRHVINHISRNSSDTKP